MQRRVLSLMALAASACAAKPAPAFVSAECSAAGPTRTLPVAIRETSGLSLSRSHPGILWTHNDSGNEPLLYALDTAGMLAGTVRVRGANLVDWEDMAAGPCDSGSCLFIADIGDNGGKRESVSIYMVPEPSPADSVTAPATRFSVRYPDRPRDAEAMFVLPNGDLYIVSKGRRDSIALFRYAKEIQRADSTVTLERVRDLWPRPKSGYDRVTGATITPDGRHVAIRSYGSMFVFTSDGLLTGAAPVLTVDLKPLREPQGESVAVSDSGHVWLTSEAGDKRNPPMMRELSCRIGGTE